MSRFKYNIDVYCTEVKYTIVFSNAVTNLTTFAHLWKN